MTKTLATLATLATADRTSSLTTRFHGSSTCASDEATALMTSLAAVPFAIVRREPEVQSGASEPLHQDIP